MLSGIVEALRNGTIQNLTNQNNNKIAIDNLHNKYIALFGIGTGISHAIAEIDNNGEFKFITDGHGSKLRVQVDIMKIYRYCKLLNNVWNKLAAKKKLLF